jgi:hypothetical protein
MSRSRSRGPGGQRLLVSFVGDQSARRAAHQMDARTSQAAHTYIRPMAFNAIVKDVLNVQAGCYKCLETGSDESPPVRERAACHLAPRIEAFRLGALAAD